MSVSDIQRITLETITVSSRSPLGRTHTMDDEAICLYTPGGKVVLRRSAVEAGGGGWHKLRAGLYESAPAKGIPFEDLRSPKE